MRRSYLLAVALLLSVVAGSVWWIERDVSPVLTDSPAPGDTIGGSVSTDFHHKDRRLNPPDARAAERIDDR